MRRFAGALVVVFGLGACDVVPLPASGPTSGPASVPVPQDAILPAPASGAANPQTPGTAMGPRASARAFVRVVQQLEPVAERECRRRAPRLNCDFLVVVDDRPNLPPNAFQTVDEDGRPIIAFTLALIADAQNADEIAFIMAHEAAHHIEDHLTQQRRNAVLGAEVFGQLAGRTGASADAIRTAQEAGALAGARVFSKDFELEADRLGTIIAARAGYDPVRGAQYFFRVPDPGNQFLGTHPPNAQRVQIVLDTAAGL